MGSLEGQAVVITGAASGIGRAAAQRFAAEGAKLVIADVNEAVTEVAAAIVAGGGEARAVVADVSSEKVCQRLVQECVAAYGGVHVMFANAGIVNRIDPVVELTEGDWHELLRVNLMSPFFCLKHAAREMIERGGGSILFTASVAGLRAGGGPAHYSAGKAALLNLVRSAACQLAGTGVRVNAICPGLIETGMTKPVFDMARAAGKADKIGQLNPLRRAGQPSEVAAAALFLASEESSYVNGEALVVDGGLAASLPIVPGKLW